MLGTAFRGGDVELMSSEHISLELQKDHLRLTSGEVCALARISKATLWRRVARGHLPRPVDHARQALFSAHAVEHALAQQQSARTSETMDQAIEASLARWRRRFRK